ncbi:prolyl oligopeptidase family serine peptidase [Lactobacillus sp. LC28-10]|uniref:Prolyl oligopeptidase family serine peptidase n=1 Tax=Secundilactobacillus angelensis TaxID=2722706 RepID=A0ABX1L1Z5_9LACO|nr:alpha/beta hydrolase-fold protein [Secundilactobacillus angelensis]MCH5463026.1 alpha/beta hydrolase [Secundilactobacillus angelensis]NLR19492.1 prolyl oligopeptidase family serine peptidase [Secundilactobacillus angelensis]
MKKYLWAVIIVTIAIIGVIFGGLVHSLNPPEKHTAQSHSNQQQSAKSVGKNTRSAAKKTVTASPAPSHVISRVCYSPQLRRNWRYRVYLPKNYQRLKEQGTRFPVIYMLHGLYGDETNLTTQAHSKTYLDQLVAEKHLPVVAIFPDGGNSFYLNTSNEKMENAMVDDLIPQTTKSYQLAGQKQRAIGGISMGGYGAARLTFRHPQLFSVDALVSPAIWQKVPATVQSNPQVDAFRTNGAFNQKAFEQAQPSRYLTSYLNQTKSPAHFYIETTALDTTVPIADVNLFVGQLKQHQIKSTYQVDHFGNHNWPYWNRALPNAYRYIFNQFKSQR